MQLDLKTGETIEPKTLLGTLAQPEAKPPPDATPVNELQNAIYTKLDELVPGVLVEVDENVSPDQPFKAMVPAEEYADAAKEALIRTTIEQALTEMGHNGIKVETYKQRLGMAHGVTL